MQQCLGDWKDIVSKLKREARLNSCVDSCKVGHMRCGQVGGWRRVPGLRSGSHWPGRVWCGEPLRTDHQSYRRRLCRLRLRDLLNQVPGCGGAPGCRHQLLTWPPLHRCHHKTRVLRIHNEVNAARSRTAQISYKQINLILHFVKLRQGSGKERQVMVKGERP